MSLPSRGRVSFALNFLLALVVAVLVARAFRNSAAHPVQARAVPKAKAVTTQPVERVENMRYDLAAEPTDPCRSIIEQLRAMGVPNDVMALVARVDCDVAWERRFAECRGDMNKLAAVQLKMNMSRDAEMRAALGDEGYKQWDTKYKLWEAMSTEVPVTPAEAERIYSLKKKLQQSQFTVEQARLDGKMDDASISEAYDRTYADFYQQLKDVLGDERYAKSQQLDADFVAGNLKYTLASVNPSDEQFQQLFKIEEASKQSRLELDHQFENDRTSPDYLAKVKALDEAHDLEYQRVLGENAFATLQKSQDPTYNDMKKYENLWGLDDGKVDQAYNTLKQYRNAVADYQAQVHSLQAAGQNIPLAAVNNNLMRLASEAQQTLQGSIGESSLTKLQRNRIFQVYQAQPGPRAPM